MHRGEGVSGPDCGCVDAYGQLTMLRGMAEAPVKAENYFKATIQAGCVGFDQAKPNVEF